MRPFDYFLDKKEVVKVTPDEKEAASLVEDALHRFDYFAKEELWDENAKFIFENIYESIRELLDAVLLKEGYKSYSHQAPIVFASDKEIISHKESFILDNLRELRNKSKYYGKKIDADLVREKILDGKKIFTKVKSYLTK